MSSTGANNQETVKSVSTESLVTSIITNVIVLGIELGVFVLIFRQFPAIYEPRAFLTPLKEDRVDQLPKSLWRWAIAIWKADSKDIISKNGLDSYMFLRFLNLMLRIFIPFWIISWLLLIPIDVTGGGTQKGLYRLTFGNIGVKEQPRYAVDVILVYFFTFYVYHLVRKEMSNFIVLRHVFLTSREHTRLAQSRTVLVTGIPPEFRSEKALDKLSDYFPGGVEKTWLSRDLGKNMPDLYKRQVKAASKLEEAETKLMKTAAQQRVKTEKQIAQADQKEKKSEHKQDINRNGKSQSRYNLVLKTFDAEKAGSPAEQLVAKKDRPTHKIGSKIPFFGKKTDTIDWCKQELATVTDQLKEERSRLDEKPSDSSAFLLFRTQIAAHMFAQTTIHHLPLRMASRYTEVAPEEVIWGNLSINPYQQRIRYALSWTATIGLVIAWSFPVAFVGLLSNVNSLCAKAHWLRWLCTLPVPINGIIQGVLPPVALGVLFILLPIILRLLATFEGIPLKNMVELAVMKRYFLFLVIHGFLIVTLASGLVKALPAIANNPGSTVSLLAQNLPAASNFFLTYLVTTGLSGAASSFIQIVTLILHYVFIFILASTPRKVYSLNHKMQSANFGTLFPNITLLTVISMAYSIISPLINGFAVVCFALFAYSYKYLFIWVYDQPRSSETGGLFFPIAIHHLFAGLYIEQLCLAGLFFLARNEHDHPSAIPEGALMIVLIVFTLLYHVLIFSSYGPLIKNLPVDLGMQIDPENSSGMSPGQKNTRLAKVKLGIESKAVGMQEKVMASGNKMREEIREAAQIDLLRRLGRKPNKEEAEQYALSNLVSEPPDNGNLVSGSQESFANGSNEQAQQDHHQAEVEGIEVSDSAFNHPASWQELKPIWLPADELGIGESEASHIRSLGIDSTTQGATMDHTGHVHTSRPPPEEDTDF